jgi:hypothetical protein
MPLQDFPQDFPDAPEVTIADEELIFGVHVVDAAVAGNYPDLDTGGQVGGDDVVDLVGDPGFQPVFPAARFSHAALH